ncbi:MAG: hypothetical protein WDM90_24900 [Ferruginibacter sp.]
MLLDKFNKLNSMQKTAIVWQCGVPVSEIQDKYYSYSLYQLFDFYVEIKFLRTNYVFFDMCGFTAQSSHLDLYIKQIDVASYIN